MTPVRRTLLRQAGRLAAACALPWPLLAPAADGRRDFNPRPGPWRTFDVTTRVDVQGAEGLTRVWLPLPSVDSDWQQSLDNAFQTNGEAELRSDMQYGARLLAVRFAPGEPRPWVELTSRVRTRNRAVDWQRRDAAPADAASLRFWTQPTALLPTDGIVRQTALAATRGAQTDVDKARRLYDWVVTHAYREPKVRGCGLGDIRTMLETGILGGKCADLNALFVGLCRAVGLPARDVYGLRLAPSAFGYRQLGGQPDHLAGAQHCRAEVYLRGHGWVAMDPADVTKVMRHETDRWIRRADDPVVAPVNRALFGGWEGNWLAWNMAHDVALPGAEGARLGFLMYPMCETGHERLDPYAPEAFRFRIQARELTG